MVAPPRVEELADPTGFEMALARDVSHSGNLRRGSRLQSGKALNRGPFWPPANGVGLGCNTPPRSHLCRSRSTPTLPARRAPALAGQRFGRETHGSRSFAQPLL